MIRRYAAIWRGDLQALGAMLGQSLLVAILLGSVFGNLNDVSNPDRRVQQSLNMLLLLSVSCFWFGCNTAAKELVKERPIFLRERDFNLRAAAYFASKFAVLALIAALQATLLFVMVRAWCQPAGSAPQQWVVLNALAHNRHDDRSLDLGAGAIGRGRDRSLADRGHPAVDPGGRGRPAERTHRIPGEGFYLGLLGPAGTRGIGIGRGSDILGAPQGPFHGLWELVPVLAHAAVGVIATIVVLRRTDGKTRTG